MSNQIQDLARWKSISQGQCAFRSTNAQSNNLRCKHLFTNTSECHYVGCPIVQPNYVALQRSYDAIYIVIKDINAEKFSETWKDEELPELKEEALAKVEQSVSNLNETLKSAVTKKFDHLYSVSSTIRESSDSTDKDEGDSDEDLEIEEDLEVEEE